MIRLHDPRPSSSASRASIVEASSRNWVAQAVDSALTRSSPARQRDRGNGRRRRPRRARPVGEDPGLGQGRPSRGRRRNRSARRRRLRVAGVGAGAGVAARCGRRRASASRRSRSAGGRPGAWPGPRAPVALSGIGGRVVDRSSTGRWFPLPPVDEGDRGSLPVRRAEHGRFRTSPVSDPARSHRTRRTPVIDVVAAPRALGHVRGDRGGDHHLLGLGRGHAPTVRGGRRRARRTRRRGSAPARPRSARSSSKLPSRSASAADHDSP